MDGSRAEVLVNLMSGDALGTPSRSWWTPVSHPGLVPIMHIMSSKLHFPSSHKPIVRIGFSDHRSTVWK